MGHRWVRGDSRITPRLAHLQNSGSWSRKTQKNPENWVLPLFAQLRPILDTYRNGRGIHRSVLMSGSRWCQKISGFPDPDRARAGKLVFPFRAIVAQPWDPQTSTQHQKIGLDLRIPTVPKYPDFRVRMSRKIRKTEKKGKLENCM